MDKKLLDKLAEIIKDGVCSGDSSWDEIAVDVVRAMREPTEAQYNALCATGRMWRDLDSLTVWQTYIDAITGAE